MNIEFYHSLLFDKRRTMRKYGPLVGGWPIVRPIFTWSNFFDIEANHSFAVVCCTVLLLTLNSTVDSNTRLEQSVKMRHQVLIHLKVKFYTLQNNFLVS